MSDKHLSSQFDADLNLISSKVLFEAPREKHTRDYIRGEFS